ncbi:MAG: hypothetical protein EBX24_08605, partial [Actinobacteria bacterium]|nr:hypothetical protein [Actinomycetota bacterium]
PTPTPTPTPGTDTQIPVIVSGTVSQSALEVCQTLSAVTARVTDNTAVVTVNIRIVDPTNAQVASFGAYRFEGNALSGNYKNDWVVPCNARAGKYRAEVMALDAARNATAWTLAGEFTVNPPATPDTSAPSVITGSVSQTSVTLCKTISEVRAQVRDDSRVKNVIAGLFNSMGASVTLETLYLKSGTAQDGSWWNDMTVPCSTPVGTYTVMARAMDQWDKNSEWKTIGSISVVAATPATAPAPAPSSSPVTKTAQRITMSALVDWERNAAQQLAATSTSGLAVTYSSLTPEVCFILNTGTGMVVQRQARLVDAPSWTCTIRANQAGDARFDAAPAVDTTFKFLKARTVIAVTSSSSLTGAG